jgi:hypothetical protein
MGNGRPGIHIVDERYAVPDEYVVFDVHAFTDEGVARDFAATANARIFLNLDERANFRFVSDFAAVQVYEL